MKELIFYYDVVCPFAFIASRLVEGLARRTNATLQWRPVLLGGLYEGTKAPQGKDGSATDVMSAAKRQIVNEDLIRTMKRHGIVASFPSGHPVQSLKAMRLLSATDFDGHTRVQLTHQLYKSYWVDNKDITDSHFLQSVVADIGWHVDVDEVTGKQSVKDELRRNTDEALKHGAFGVPSFCVNNRLYFGVDRMHFVEQELNGNKVAMPRMVMPPAPGVPPLEAKLTIFHDFSSPWSYLGSQQIRNLVDTVSPVRVTVEWVPILLGALFKETGTPLVPLAVASPAKVAYGQLDIQDWARYGGNISIRWPSNFPLRTVTPLRVSIAEPSDKLRDAIYQAAWADDKNIADVKVLTSVLESAGFDGQHLISVAGRADVKEQLKINTSRAVAAGACGVPSYMVNDGPTVIWGQDRLNVVADMLCGWKDEDISTAKL
ncbi:uncharacterized protein LOC134196160 [Corticium candelabrum]|uniref:uncharacterized protein LOC134196160 n=1 Tax=Corticium candelabrum TaxID=121492 RepID=UPI002E259042|nr:uncharacterized protein LOC134196160 [Corticium candelabrum]